MRRAAFVLLAMIGFIATIARPVSASSITIGGPGDGGGNCVPFGCPGLLALHQYQQVYNGAMFGESMLIDTISFFNNLSSPGEVHEAYYLIFLSTTGRSANELDAVSLDNNVGLDNALFYSGTLGGTGSIVGGIFSIAGSPFVYNPALGNLLLDVQISNVAPGTPPTVYLDFRGGTFGTDSSRACGGEVCGSSSGLVTGFSGASLTPVPEPTSIILLGTGLVGAGVRRWRRRL